ncbi:Yet1 protein [Saccharomycopsis crataegensis]|uniref:Endoplasmic reticulum transmembrane protein n=1 Tax=Saccharomycopsis crataegensis TaxID=43959 RepID=A0AAV5QHE2_9ASCO|nr:Yet1 protein [Saccharomycopsis crataegensis]
MSLYMSLIFGVLVAEMAIVTVLLLPLPHKIRKKIVQFSFFIWNQTQIRVAIMVCSALVGLMFVDSAQRSFKHPLVREAEAGPAGHLSHGYNELSSSEYLARKFYNQRNFYLTGIVLCLGMAIPTILILLEKIIKWDNILKSTNGGSSVDSIKKQLDAKDKDIATLKKQIEGLQKAYNEKADAKNPVSGDSKKSA